MEHQSDFSSEDDGNGLSSDSNEEIESRLTVMLLPTQKKAPIVKSNWQVKIGFVNIIMKGQKWKKDNSSSKPV